MHQAPGKGSGPVAHPRLGSNHPYVIEGGLAAIEFPNPDRFGGNIDCTYPLRELHQKSPLRDELHTSALIHAESRLCFQR